MDSTNLQDQMFMALSILMAGASISFLGLCLNSLVFGKKIESQGELDRLIEKESKKLGLEGIKIKGNFYESVFEGRARRLDENSGEIDLGKIYRNLGGLRHEIYHIKRVVKDKKIHSYTLPGIINYVLNEEPRAIIYQLFNINL